MLKAQCHCRECQYISGGGPNFFLLISQGGLEYVLGAPKEFRRSDLDNAVTREFCSACGTHTSSHRPGIDGDMVKVGTLDDPGYFETSQFAFFTLDKQSFHRIPKDTRCYETLPKR